MVNGLQTACMAGCKDKLSVAPAGRAGQLLPQLSASERIRWGSNDDGGSGFMTGSRSSTKRQVTPRRRVSLAMNLLAAFAALLPAAPAIAQTPAKQVFGRMAMPDNAPAAAHGFYSKGCLSGGIAMPVDGPTWQVMRLSRNRRWGHPDLIALVEELSIRAKRDGWNGLMVGDISQPRGGPMLTGHASHQIGLDADLWFMPMPDRRLNYREREETSAVSVLRQGTNHVDDARWTKAHERVLYHAASFPQTERILVHPGVKKKLCETVSGDRSWLRKIRPFYGHHYHFHLRISCPPGSQGCRPQNPTPAGTGCDDSLDWWFDVALKPKKPSTGPERKPKVTTVDDLPASCKLVVDAPSKPERLAEYRAPSLRGFSAPQIDLPRHDPLAALASRPIEASRQPASASAISGFAPLPATVPVPTPRPY